MSANIIVKSCVLTALLVTVFTVVTGENAIQLECVDSLHMPAMLEYVNKSEGSYFDEKERAQLEKVALRRKEPSLEKWISFRYLLDQLNAWVWQPSYSIQNILGAQWSFID